MKFIATSLAVFCLNTTGAFALDKITGISEYTFGTTFDEISEKHILTEQESASPANKVYVATKKIEVVGDEYEIYFGFSDNRLDRINLARLNYSASTSSCIRDFEEVVGVVTASYGSPDMNPAKGDPTSMTASF